MKFVLATLSLLLSLSLTVTAFPVPLQNNIDVGAIDIMQEKKASTNWQIIGQSCGETDIQITNSKGALMTTHHSPTGDINWAFSTATWPAGTYTVLVDADDSACSSAINFAIGK